MDAEKMQCLTNALEYIENNLSGEITQQQCAMAACCSVSGLQKTFKSIFRIGVSDYITRRRLTKAAELLQKGEHSALEIAMICGYGSAEAFTRAFTRVWGVTPTVYKKEWSFSNLFPRQQTSLAFLISANKQMIKYDICRASSGMTYNIRT